MKYIPLDIETVGLRMWGGIIWIVSFGRKLYHDCFGKLHYFAAIKRDLEDPNTCKVIHNAIFDAAYIEMNTGIKVRNIWCTRAAEVVIQGTQIPRNKPKALSERAYEKLKEAHSSSLKYTLKRYGFPVPDKTLREEFIDRPKGLPFRRALLEYAQGDTDSLLQLQKAQEYLLTRDGGMETALLENMVAERVAGMQVRGLGIDTKLWREISDANLQEYRRLIKGLPKEVENWNSTQQVKKFFRNRGVMIVSYKDGGLEKAYALTKDKVLGQFIKARDLYSDATTYSASWLINSDGSAAVDPDGRIRCQWEQILKTGRFSTSNPNILALPKEGNQRSAIVPRKGCVFIIGDYSGQEIGIIAAGSGEELWINTLLRGESIHSLVASRLFPVEWAQGKDKGCTFPKKCKCHGHQDVTGTPYFKAKKLNFMLAYGGGPGKFAAITGCTELVARVTVKKYKKIIPQVTAWLDANAAEALETGIAYSADPYRRRMVLKGQEDWQIENQGKNYPVQSPGANMLKLAMVSMPEWVPIVLPFHDELVAEVPEKVAKKAQKIMKQIMEQSADYVTGIKGLIKVEPRIARNFAKH